MSVGAKIAGYKDVGGIDHNLKYGSSMGKEVPLLGVPGISLE